MPNKIFVHIQRKGNIVFSCSNYSMSRLNACYCSFVFVVSVNNVDILVRQVVPWIFCLFSLKMLMSKILVH